MKLVHPAHTDNNYINGILETNEPQVLLPPRLLEAFDLSNFSAPRKGKLGLFSSGTTGEPKIIWHCWEGLLQNAILSADSFQPKKDEKILILASPWHVAGLSWALMARQEKTQWKIEAPYANKLSELRAMLIAGQFRTVFTVPSVATHFAQFEDWHVEKLVIGGGRLEVETGRKLLKRSDVLMQAYGQTEAGGLISTKTFLSQDNYSEHQTQNVGSPPAGISLRCEGAPENPAPIFVSSPSASNPDTFYDTGDDGFLLNEELYLSGRRNAGGGRCNTLTAISSIMHK